MELPIKGVKMLKNAYSKTREVASRHRVCLVVGAVAFSVIALQTNGIQKMNGFLKEHGLFDEYYKLDEELPTS